MMMAIWGDQRVAELGNFFSTLNYRLVMPDILLPAGRILDLTGEDVRQRMYITSDETGAEYCLRPDFTVPVCDLHLQGHEQRNPCGYWYAGSVFRQPREIQIRPRRPEEARLNPGGESVQAGVEYLGGDDHAATDATLLWQCAESLKILGQGRRGQGEYDIEIGDKALFAAILEAADLPEIWVKRLYGAFGDPMRMGELYQRIKTSGEQKNGVSADLARLIGKGDNKAAGQLIREILAGLQIQPVGRRSIDEIADSYVENCLGGYEKPSGQALDIVRAYLSIRSDAASSPDLLRRFWKEQGIAADDRLEEFCRRIDSLKARDFDMSRMFFSASFGRRLEYYTGFNFQIIPSSGNKEEAFGANQTPLASGGRYDRLLKMLGAENDIPASGFSIRLDRLVARGSKNA